MGGQERHDGRRSGGTRSARGDRANELQELLPGPCRKPVMRVGDDVGVNMIAQVEPHSDRLRAGPVRVVVGDCRNPRREREADGHRGGRADGVRRPRQLRRAGRGREGPGIHHTPGVNGAETGMHSPGKLIEDVEQIAREFGGHDANLLIMVKCPGRARTTRTAPSPVQVGMILQTIRRRRQVSS